MNESPLPSGSSSEIPPPPEGYDPEKPVVFNFQIFGTAFFVWDFTSMKELCENSKDFANSDADRIDVRIDGFRCSVFEKAQDAQAEKPLEDFDILLDQVTVERFFTAVPTFGIISEEEYYNAEFIHRGKWNQRSEIALSAISMNVAGGAISASDAIRNCDWLHPYVESPRFFSYGNQINTRDLTDFQEWRRFDPAIVARWPFSDLLASAFLLLNDMDYVLLYSAAAHKPPNREVLTSDIAAGSGWEVFLEMVEQMPEDKRRWINCPQEDIQRLLRAVRRSRAGTGAAHASLELS